MRRRERPAAAPAVRRPARRRRSAISITGGAIESVIVGGHPDPAKLFAHDPTPATAHWTRQRGRPAAPERALLHAMLTDALDLLARHEQGALPAAASERRKFLRDCTQARAWLLDATDQPWGCAWTCALLGIASDGLRAHVRRIAPALPAPESDPTPSAPLDRTLPARAWQWACAQSRPWTSRELAQAMDCSLGRAYERVRDWVRRRGLEHVSRVAGPGAPWSYRVPPASRTPLNATQSPQEASAGVGVGAVRVEVARRARGMGGGRHDPPRVRRTTGGRSSTWRR